MLLNSIKSRLHPDGKLKKQMGEMHKLYRNNKDSDFAKSMYKKFRNKFYRGKKSTTYFSLILDAWQKFITLKKDNIIEINDLKFINDPALICEFSEIFLSDVFENMNSYTGEVYIAAKILSLLSNDGSYQTNDVFIEPNDVVIDAGANMGVFSVFAAKKAKKIYAFEPQQKVCDVLSENIIRNGLADKVNIIPYGLAEEDKTVNLYYKPEQGHISASINKPKASKYIEETIQCKSLDSWIIEENLEKIDFIKADIEGAERYMLLGAKRILKEFSPKLSICTYHLPDDPQILEDIILSANPKYKIEHLPSKLYAKVS